MAVDYSKVSYVWIEENAINLSRVAIVAGKI